MLGWFYQDFFCVMTSGRNPFETTYQTEEGTTGPVTEKSHSRATPKCGWSRDSNGSSGFDLSPHLYCVLLGSTWWQNGCCLFGPVGLPDVSPARGERPSESGQNKTLSSGSRMRSRIHEFGLLNHVPSAEPTIVLRGPASGTPPTPTPTYWLGIRNNQGSLQRPNQRFLPQAHRPRADL